MPESLSAPEQFADHATDYAAFPIKLAEIKRVVAEVLSLFGRSKFFEQYTVHDVRHINDMLNQLEWIIPSTTKAILTPADWLLIVLSIYFHDMGLVVTEKEFENRSQSGFTDFCRLKLFNGSDGSEYEAKLANLLDGDRERFLYQEFVRANHGKRVRAWIEGTDTTFLGYTQQQSDELSRLLEPLTMEFRRDLALVCESHNLDDLDRDDKYITSQPYGNSDAETANVQYCAAILRTVDLLQITNKRTPTTMFRLISPTDPISQSEWAKQNAVRRIRAKVEIDRDGNADPAIQSQTVEVFATFNDENSFFGLTSYLKYAASQLQETYNVVQNAAKSHGKKYIFPWRYIDGTHVGVNGCLPAPFSFNIDQEKILTLLTGHTLYNNSDVVVRELVQNAIDAVRLQGSSDPQWLKSSAYVKVFWNTKKLELIIEDNGTGMTQAEVENHLLKVGSSKYQDPKFKESNPRFSPISKFGIGVLSSFMVADAVEIVTVSQKEEHARRLSLRSVQGVFLVKLLDKNSDRDASSLGLHGTRFKLSLRKNAKNLDVLDVIKQYIRFPRCKVSVSIDDGQIEYVGYNSPKEALEDYIANPIAPIYERDKIRVIEKSLNGVTLAYAQRYNSHFRDYNFVSVPERRRRFVYETASVSPVATCIEGIAVEFDSPGFQGGSVLAIVDIVGQNAPKTNVARSLVEGSDSKQNAIASIYRILFDEVSSEVLRLHNKEGYSLTWSVEQVPYLSGLITSAARVQNEFRDIHRREMGAVPMFIMETADKREAKSLNDMKSIEYFWTVDSELMRSVERFVREARSEVTAKALLATSQGTTTAIPQGALLANSHQDGLVRQSYLDYFEPTYLEGSIQDRRLDIKWEQADGRWIHIDALAFDLHVSNDQDIALYLQEIERDRDSVASARMNVKTKSLEDYAAVFSDSRLYILPDNPISSLIADISGEDLPSKISQHVYMSMFQRMISINRNASAKIKNLADDIERVFVSVTSRLPAQLTPSIDKFKEALLKTDSRAYAFDPLSWSQREKNLSRYD